MNISGDHIRLLPLVPGMKVTITDNAAVSARIVSGSEGILQDITYNMDSNGSWFAVCVLTFISLAVTYRYLDWALKLSQFYQLKWPSFMHLDMSLQKRVWGKAGNVTSYIHNFLFCLHMPSSITRFKAIL